MQSLALKEGQTVLDVGCGTGLSFEMLRAGVGGSGRVIGVEHSADMAALARQRIARSGWTNVCVIEAPAQEAVLPLPVDAVLLNYTHDICRSVAAIRNLLGQARAGARIGMAGIKYMPWWVGPLNLIVYLKNRPYNGFPGELWTPWDIVQRWVPDLRIESTQWGMGYVAHGLLAAPPARGDFDAAADRNTPTQARRDR